MGRNWQQINLQPNPYRANAFPQTKRPRSSLKDQARHQIQKGCPHPNQQRASSLADMAQAIVPPTTAPMRALSLDCFRK